MGFETLQDKHTEKLKKLRPLVLAMGETSMRQGISIQRPSGSDSADVRKRSIYLALSGTTSGCSYKPHLGSLGISEIQFMETSPRPRTPK